MNLDIESIKQTIGAFSAALIAMKQAKDLLPDASQKQEVNIAIESAERKLRIAESQTAHILGYELCRNHFPPEIMLSKDNKIWICPNPQCENQIDKNIKRNTKHPAEGLESI